MVSIIIPVLNEAAQLPKTFAAIQAQKTDVDLLVVDGGSTDESARVAAEAGALVLSHLHPQRAAQMNAGAKIARGDILLFLHADTRLPPTAITSMEQALRNPKVLGGGFARRFDQDSIFLRLTCWLAEWRTRAFGWFLGDQAIFVRRSVFQEFGGFREWDIFEDLDFSRRLARAGQVVTLAPPVVSSGRRFTTRGAARTTWHDLLLTWRYLFAKRTDITRESRATSDRLEPQP